MPGFVLGDGMGWGGVGWGGWGGMITFLFINVLACAFKSLPENWNANHGELAKLLARRKQILLGKASRNGFQTPWNLLVASADKSTQNCCSTSAVGSGAVKKRTTVSHTCANLWKQCMRDEVKKSCFGDPSWKMHFQNLHEMQVLEASCVQKRTTPSREPSLFNHQNCWKMGFQWDVHVDHVDLLLTR